MHYLNQFAIWQTRRGIGAAHSLERQSRLELDHITFHMPPVLSLGYVGKKWKPYRSFTASFSIHPASSSITTFGVDEK